MSQENVEVVRAALEAWNTGDMDALRDIYDPEIIMRPPHDWPESGPFIGRDAVMRQWEQQRELFDADTMELVGELIHAADQVAIRFVWHGAGRGLDTGLEVTNVMTVRDGKLLRQTFYRDHAEALEALGLSE